MNTDITDGLIDKWASEAMDDLGKKGWREISPNSLMLIIYAIQRNRDRNLAKKITKPVWWLFGAIGTGIVWLIVSSLIETLGGGGG